MTISLAAIGKTVVVIGGLVLVILIGVAGFKGNAEMHGSKSESKRSQGAESSKTEKEKG